MSNDRETVRRGAALGTHPSVGGRLHSWKNKTAEQMHGASLRFGRFAFGVLAVAALAACGAAAGSGVNSGPAAPPPATSAAPASPPPGGPAPPQLIGAWTQLDAAPAVAPVVLTLTGSTYDLHTRTGEGSGAIVVNGDEIDFFSSNRCADHPLPSGVGRYQWTVQGATLHLSPLNADPCGRIDYLNNKSYTRSVT